MKSIDVIYMKQVLTLTRFWGDNRLCLGAKNPSQIDIPKMEFVGGIPMNGAYLLIILLMMKKVRLQIYVVIPLIYTNI